MWYCYILYSPKINKYYTGYTEDLTKRVQRHNDGWGKYTKRGIPWELKYYEEYEYKTDAIKREREIKDKKSRRYIEDLISTGKKKS